MSIEALVEKKFSTASDIWAFGVTLWEMFSLAEEPFGDLIYNEDFADQLGNGLRLPCPKLASTEL